MKLSIILVTYLESNKPYLDLCIRSIINNALPVDEYEVILVSSGDYIPELPNLPNWKQAHNCDRMHYPEACNFGVKQSTPGTKYLMLLGDDAILTKNSLVNILNGLGDGEIIVNPTSNCDNSYMYSLILGYVANGQFNMIKDRFYRYDAWKDIQTELMNAESIYPEGLIQRPFVAFYATIIPRKVWEKVGEQDENFKTGQDDADYCKRAMKLGIPSAVALNSLIWHFGGVTADKALDQETRDSNIAYYTKKWGEAPP